MDDRDEDLPLHNEAAARGKWRGETLIKKGGEDLGLPSEADNASVAGADGSSDGRPGKGGPGAIPPPD